MTSVGTFERERRELLPRFTIHGDRKKAAFVTLRSGLSHDTGHIQFLMTPAEARQLGETLVAMAEFAAKPMPGDA